MQVRLKRKRKILSLKALPAVTLITIVKFIFKKINNRSLKLILDPLLVRDEIKGSVINLIPPELNPSSGLGFTLINKKEHQLKNQNQKILLGWY